MCMSCSCNASCFTANADASTRMLNRHVSHITCGLLDCKKRISLVHGLGANIAQIYASQSPARCVLDFVKAR